MALRFEYKTSKHTVCEPPKVTTLAANTPTVVLKALAPKGAQIPNVQTDWGIEITARYIFNDSGGKLYFAYGNDDCDNIGNYHGAIADQGTLDVSNYAGQVSVFSVGGGKVSVRIIHNADVHVHGGILSQPAMQT